MRLGVNMDNLNDVNLDGLNLLFGDCLERMKEIPDGSVDLILTDPNILCYNPIYLVGLFHVGE